MSAQLELLAPPRVRTRIEPSVLDSAPLAAPLALDSEPILRGDWITAQIFAVCFVVVLVMHIYEALASWLWR